MHQRWRPTQSSVQNEIQPLQTNGHVLWPVQLPSHVSKYDESHILPNERKVGEKRSKIIIYMDDILIAMSTLLQDHRDATHDVRDLLQEHDLFLKKKKYRWEVDSIDYLGLILEKGVTCMNPTKVEGIKNWPRPTKVKDVCSFLGFCNFYHSFIPSFSTTAKPLNKLTCKDNPLRVGR